MVRDSSSSEHDDQFTLEPPPYPEPARQGGGCLRGCLIVAGVSLALLVVVLSVGGYFAYKFVKEGFTDDPAKLSAWLQETLPSKLPPGYEMKLGVDFAGMRFLLAAPAGFDAKPPQDEKEEELADTVLMVFSARYLNVDQLSDEMTKQIQKDKRGPRNEEDVRRAKEDLLVGGKKISGNRSEWTDEGKKYVQYDVVPRPGVIVGALGPAEKFDRKAFDAFLGSIQPEPASLPTPKEADVPPKNGGKEP